MDEYGLDAGKINKIMLEVEEILVNAEITVYEYNYILHELRKRLDRETAQLRVFPRNQEV